MPFHKSGATGNILPSSPPPPYSNSAPPTRSKWNPLAWRRRTLVLATTALIITILAIILGAVLGARANAYPDYSKLNYSLADTYSGSDFFDNFDYFTGYDTTSGFVHYVDSAGSEQLNLTYATSSRSILRVDTSEDNASTGRKSVRITSKNTYNSGLFIFDITHTPYGCGTWPALWLTDPSNWPAHGEIDVLEAVNKGNTGNQVTLHTTKDCKMNHKRKETGKVLKKDCYNGTNDNSGCGVQGSDSTYGESFNTNQGGVYAMEWRTAGIRVWFFERSDIPSDISNGSSPDPSFWGTALADFPNTGCDVSNHFKNQSIIANIDLCGSWAGQTSVYGTEGGCPGTCTDYVAQNASAFDDAYWEWKSWKVYTAQ